MLRPMPAPGPGDLLGGCRIEETIGRGGMGVVYRARQDDLGRDVAIKVIAPERARRSGGAAPVPARAARDGGGRASQRGPGPRGRPRGRLRLHRDALRPGTDLRSLVRVEGPLEPERARRDRGRLGEALDAIHDAGYVHRDVKPANVLIEPRRPRLPQRPRDREGGARAGHDDRTGPLGRDRSTSPRPSRSAAARSTGARTSTRSAACSSSCSPATCRSSATTDEARMWAQLSEPPPVPSSLRAGAAGRDRRDRGARAREGPGRAARLDRGARPRRAGGAVGRPDGRGAAAARAAPRRRRRAVAALAGVAGLAAAVAGGLALLGPDEPEERASSAQRPAGTPAPSGPSVGAATRGIGYRPRSIAVAGGAVWVLELRGARARAARPGDAGAGRAAAANRQGGHVRGRARP